MWSCFFQSPCDFVVGDDAVEFLDLPFRGAGVVGDGFLAEFSSVLDAVTCSIQMQRALESNLLDFRMGLHLGDVVDDGRDMPGPAFVWRGATARA